MSSLDTLRREVDALLARHAVGDRVTVKESAHGDATRLNLERVLPDEVRYLQLVVVTNEPRVWDYSLLGGRYRCSHPARDFDGRRGGDLVYTLRVIEHWLITLGDWDNIGPYESDW